MFLAESYASGHLPSLGSRIRLSSQGVSGEFVYAGLTESGDIVAVPLLPMLHDGVCEPLACPGARVEQIEDQDSDFDARCLLSLLEGPEYRSKWPHGEAQGNFVPARLAVSPRPGDVLEVGNTDLVFCGDYRSKWVLATRGSHSLQPLGTIRVRNESWNVGVLPSRDAGILCDTFDADVATDIFRLATQRPFPGSRVRINEVDGIYLRWDGRFGLHHLIGFPIQESTRSKISRFDIDRVVETDAANYAVCWVSLNQNMQVFDIPDPEHTRHALRIAETPATCRRYL